MEENKITAITKEKEEVLKDVYKDTLEILDAYDHQTLTRPEGTYYDGNETIEEAAVNMLYDMIKNPVSATGQRKVLILGNHDAKGAYKNYFDEIYTGPLFIAEKILLSHEPVYGLPWCLNIHGHDHNDMEPYKEELKTDKVLLVNFEWIG